MIFKIFICIFLIYFSIFAYAVDLSFATKPSDLFQYSIVKREVNLEVYHDIKQVKEEHKNDNDVVNVCEDDNDKPCKCHEKAVTCLDRGLTTANLRPGIPNFVVESVFLKHSQNLILEKNKIFPENEATINKMIFIESKITKIDNNVFDNLISLRTLVFFYSSMPLIDKNILTEELGKTLSKLEMGKCEMTNIRLSIFKNLVNLEELNLRENQQAIGTYEGTFPESLSKLQVLNLQSCNLSSLNADTFKYLRNLVDLNLSFNKFTSIPSTIKFLPNLKSFDFERNELTAVKKNDFAANVKLENISFVSNYKLRLVENCAFCNLERSLKRINFYWCLNLSYIDENAFGSICNGVTPKLEMFNIMLCNVSVLHENLLDWKNVEKLILFGNPLACNCSMAWLFNDLMSNNSIYEEKITKKSLFDQKFHLGCLGPPPLTRNYTIPNTIVEIFSSCEKTSSSSNTKWYFLLLFLFLIAVVVSVSYANRHRCKNLYLRFI